MTQEKELDLIRISDVAMQKVKWLWYPYIPFGKITIIQGDPGEGKTTLALHLAAMCSMGSIDFRAAARSVLLVGRLKDEKDVRIIVHDKSSLAPEGKSLAFSIGDPDGFRWLDGYGNISAEELLSGCRTETKTVAAESLIRDMLSGGNAIPADEIFQTAQSRNISRRTVNEAKKNIPGIVSKKVGKK